MNYPKAKPADVDSIDAIIKVLYDCISGPAGKKRDWERERSLYFPGARLMPTTNPGGPHLPLEPNLLDVEGFIARVESFFATTGFYEYEVARVTEQFGQIAHVWSIYEAKHDLHDPKPFMRGINSIQLFHDGSRWWVVSIYWQQESDKHPIPEKYLEKVTRVEPGSDG